MNEPSSPGAPDELEALPELMPDEPALDDLPELIPVREEPGQEPGAPALDDLPELVPVGEVIASPAEEDLDDLPELLPVSEPLQQATEAAPELEALPELVGEPVEAEAGALEAIPELIPEGGTEAGEEAVEESAEEVDEVTQGSYRKLYATTFHGMERDLRIARAHTASGDLLCALCFDPEPGVIQAVLENVELRLMHARLIAEHHQNPIGLDALGRRAEFARDTAVRRLLMRNNQAPEILLRKVLSPLSLPLLFRANLGHENSERARKVGREVLRTKFTQASPEERVTLILRTEGRCLQVLVGVTFDQKMTSLLCSRSYQSTLLVQSLARFPALPPVLVTTLLKQPLVQRSMPLKKLLLQHKNCPSALKR